MQEKYFSFSFPGASDRVFYRRYVAASRGISRKVPPLESSLFIPSILIRRRDARNEMLGLM